MCARFPASRPICRSWSRRSRAVFRPCAQHLRGEDGQIRRFINFYVNEEDIRFLGNDTYAFKEGDEILVIPSIAGGCF
jgi:molybdopterin synthase sulfur carrier subunit